MTETFWQVDSLQAKLLEKLEQSLVDLQLNVEDISSASVDSSDSSEQRNTSKSVPSTAHEVSNNSLHNFDLSSFAVLACEMDAIPERMLLVLHPVD